MKVLFICNANVGRSQVAEALFNQLSDEPAASAGTVADAIVERTKSASRSLKDGGSSAITYMNEQGVDVSESLRDQLTPEMVQDADKVIVMADEDNWPDYLRNSGKVVVWTIEDTRGMGPDSARPLYDEIKQRVQDLVREAE
jgi:protein-tyrosine-phosphatase